MEAVLFGLFYGFLLLVVVLLFYFFLSPLGHFFSPLIKILIEK